MTADATPPPAILLDALGTLVHLVDPFRSLVRELAARGVEVTREEAESAMRTEMRYYRAHCHSAGDAAALAGLRQRCAAVLQDALPPHAATLGRAELERALLAALRFAAYPDVLPALDRWHRAGASLAVVSNWDVSLHDVLRTTGLAGWFTAVFTSAETGLSKPDAAIFERALERLAVRADQAVHIGDSQHEDVAGARSAGIPAIMVVRDGQPVPRGVPTVPSLDALWPS